MFFAGAGLSGFPVVPGNNSIQPLLPLNPALVVRRKLWPKNLVPDVRSLVWALRIVISHPLAVDVIKVIQAEAYKVIEALFSLIFQ